MSFSEMSDYSARGMLTSDSKDLLRRKLVARVAFTVAASALCFCVSYVVSLRPQEQMSGVAARRIVATMQDAKAIRYRANVALPREAMGAVKSSVDKEAAIACTAGWSCPNPAWSKIGAMTWHRTVLVDVFPESFNRISLNPDLPPASNAATEIAVLPVDLKAGLSYAKWFFAGGTNDLNAVRMPWHNEPPEQVRYVGAGVFTPRSPCCVHFSPDMARG